MKINENYRLEYDLDIIVVQKRENGQWRDMGPISETAAMVWDGIQQGIERETLIEAVVAEFDGAEKNAVASDMDVLIAQLKKAGIIED